MCIRDRGYDCGFRMEPADSQYGAGKGIGNAGMAAGWRRPVSYTHLDVYKRQETYRAFTGRDF